MATDPVTSAQTNAGKYIVGLMTGALAVMIRVVNPCLSRGNDAFDPFFMERASGAAGGLHQVERNTARRKNRTFQT